MGGADIEREFPRLRKKTYSITSPADHRYNCVAWAAEDGGRWWWPTRHTYWPAGAKADLSLDAFLCAFAELGYQRAESAATETGKEKLALFADKHGLPTHAARQLPSGRWTSKLGRMEDIEHALEDLEGEAYGRVAIILERRSGPDDELR